MRFVPIHHVWETEWSGGRQRAANRSRSPISSKSATYAPRMRQMLERFGFRASLAVPLLREDRIIGGLVVRRKSTGEFRPEVIELLKTFATQSVLAIQNARLFREIEDKSRQIEAANRHKSEFLANMSHELRTPLNAIIGFSEVLGERLFGELNEKQAEYTDDILSSGRHLLSLINEILDLSKVEAGRMELELATFDLPLAIDNARTFVRERATKHGINLDVTVDERLGDFVGDERKIKQILLNLLSNAVKFTPEGGRIGINARQADGSVEISVSDTGIGIAPEDQPKIFEEFRQVGSDYAHKVEGTGLGLTLAKKFVELHGGRIWVESEVGQRLNIYVHPARETNVSLVDTKFLNTFVSGKAEQLDTVIIGGGHAGLTMSYYLSQLGREHVILERGRVGERWRSERWDSFCFQFPNWTIELPGYKYQCDDPDAFAPGREVVRFHRRLRDVYQGSDALWSRSHFAGASSGFRPLSAHDKQRRD